MKAKLQDMEMQLTEAHLETQIKEVRVQELEVNDVFNFVFTLLIIVYVPLLLKRSFFSAVILEHL